MADSEQLKFQIFGKTVEFLIQSEQRHKFINQIMEQFSLYHACPDKMTDIIVSILDELPILKELHRISPDLIILEKGFRIEYHKCTVIYLFEECIKIFLKLKICVNPILHYLKKINNIGFENIEERLGNLIFELILTPLIFFYDDKVLIHSAGLIKGNRAVLLGGKGGTGKTSICLKLCQNYSFEFFNDDIAVANKEGIFFPNLAFPKIYGYNLRANPELKKKIFQFRRWDDKLFWHLKKMILGSNKVRRKISPQLAFGGFYDKPELLAKYFILKRKKIRDFSMEKISPQSAAQITLEIILEEYDFFIKHLLKIESWLLAKSLPPIFNYQKKIEQWAQIYKEIFERAECFEVNIPDNFQHQEYLQKMVELLNG